MAKYKRTKKELINHSSVILHQMAPHLFFKKDLCSLKSIFPQFVNFLFFHGFEFFQVLGVFLGIVHFIDAVLAFMEYRKFKVQIIRGNVVWMIMILCQIMQESNKNREKTWELPQIWIAVMRTVWTLIWTTNFTNAQNVEWSGVESSDEKSFRS